MARRNGCVIGCLVAVVLGIGLLVLLLFGIGKVADVADKTLVDPKVYEAVKVGDGESEVRAKLPSGETFVTAALKDGAPAEPADSRCSYYVSSTGDSNTVLRFCFKDGKLAEKADYRMK
ncbi:MULTISPECIES: hypothetical protein [unclassified Streptomyces]|uniref:hypothetical protein n=1 Tax=unclassified Streptomyces TaxID=2593676 RepID=UPI000DC7BF60|nr:MULTISPECIES: hypothetical protein [unclassified Streptomyces]AWZ06321.1 hypothetical protein DRB89_18730 [Streptomyces sp. ICC4]AWZ15176.1 hypothetical protein DRB96_26255 [Streptomyces sp. ICC1]